MDITIEDKNYEVRKLVEEDIPQLLPIVLETAARADCVGMDEFSDLESLTEVYEYRHGATMYGIFSNETLRAGVIVRNSSFARSNTKCLANIVLFRSTELSGNQSYAQLLRISEGLAKVSGYSCCETKVFASDSKLVLLLKKEGYSFAVCMKDVVRQGNAGLSMSLSMYKDFGVTPPVVEEVVPREREGPEDFSGIDTPKVPFLPVEAYLKDGTRVIVRNVRPTEYELMFKLFMGAAGKGEGYSVDEYTSVRDFVEEVALDYYSVIIEDKSSRGVLATFQFAPTVFSRTKDTPVCDSHIAINPKYAGKGRGTELCRVMLEVCKEMGFSLMTNDTLLSHTKIIKIIYKLGFTLIGSMPRTAFVKGVGWTDCIYFQVDLDKFNSLSKRVIINNKL